VLQNEFREAGVDGSLIWTNNKDFPLSLGKMNRDKTGIDPEFPL